jgi:hypothetical protein
MAYVSEPKAGDTIVAELAFLDAGEDKRIVLLVFAQSMNNWERAVKLCAIFGGRLVFC